MHFYCFKSPGLCTLTGAVDVGTCPCNSCVCCRGREQSSWNLFSSLVTCKMQARCTERWCTTTTSRQAVMKSPVRFCVYIAAAGSVDFILSRRLYFVCSIFPLGISAGAMGQNNTAKFSTTELRKPLSQHLRVRGSRSGGARHSKAERDGISQEICCVCLVLLLETGFCGFLFVHLFLSEEFRMRSTLWVAS